jgi:hypothetical protein
MTFENKYIQQITDESHYLLRAKNNNNEYYLSFLHELFYLENKLKPKELHKYLIDKLQMKRGQFAEKNFIQFACEMTVLAYFAKKYPDSFKYENRVNHSNKKNVECTFEIDTYKYNIEVKCPTYEAKEKVDNEDAFKFSTLGRVDGYLDSLNEIGTVLQEAQKLKGEEPKPILEHKNMDNNLKDFLKSAHEKFNPITDEREVNILVVCCDDANDMQKWHGYLYAPRGLFTEKSFHNVNEYRRVDLVILTNLYHRHYNYFEKQNLSNNWRLDCAFNLVFSNLYRLHNKENAIKKFLGVFPHFTNELESYQVPGDAPLFIKDSVRISYFVKEMVTEKGLNLFYLSTGV